MSLERAPAGHASGRTAGGRIDRPRSRARGVETNELKPWLRRTWKIPPTANAAFVAAMEDVLDVYARPCDPKRPQVCFDETCKQHLREVVEPLSPQPGSPARSESTYERNGVSNLRLAFAPLEQWRHVWVADRRDAITWAHCIRELVEVQFPDAERVVVVLDNLSTHTASAVYTAFAPAEAKRMWDRLEVHYTPKHGSWRVPAGQWPRLS